MDENEQRHEHDADETTEPRLAAVVVIDEPSAGQHQGVHPVQRSENPGQVGAELRGAGAAGLSAALGLAPHRVTLLTKGRLGSSGSSPLV